MCSQRENVPTKSRAEDEAGEVRSDEEKADARNTFSSSVLLRLLGAKEKVFRATRPGLLFVRVATFRSPLRVTPSSRSVCVRWLDNFRNKNSTKPESALFAEERQERGEDINDCRGNRRLNFQHSVHFDWDAIDGIRLKIK